MKATEAKLLDFLRKSSQFIIPIYQRTYSWTEKECLQLWEDILRTGSDDRLSAHFVGSIVYVEKGLSNLTSQEPMLVIDGQQRLTTLTLILAALAKSLDGLEEGKREPIEGFSPRKLRNYYLLNPDEDGEKRYKLLLTQTDKLSLMAITGDLEKPRDPSLRVSQNFERFQNLIEARKGDFVTVCKGLAKLVLVDIALNRTQDNPQLIFESMNSTGRELSQAELIRNFILMGLEPQLQTRLYEQYWRPMEVEFGQEHYGESFDAFMRHYLTVKTGEIPRLHEVYDVFKAQSRAPEVTAQGVEPLVKELREFARYFCAMYLGSETDPELKVAFHDLKELKVDVAYPLLLELYRDFAIRLQSKPDFLAAVRLVESYVFRRAICEIPTNSMNKTFATFSKSLRKDRYLDSIKAQFMLLPSYRRFPSDDEFQRDIQTRDLYNYPRRSYWLRRMENHNRKERVSVEEYTIEHILPQNPNMSQGWKSALGDDWERVRNTWLHTLGNLTLTGYNSEYSDHPFPEKRNMEGGFKESPLKLNTGLGLIAQWNEDEIKARAGRLALQALSVWSTPILTPEVLAEFQRKPAEEGYDINQYPQLESGLLRELYDALAKEIMALDPCVTREYLKLYVAFRAESNFVTVVPKKGKLHLFLSMPFAEIQDPRGVCKDFTGRDHWGTGDIKIRLDSMDGLPYALGLVRQSLERQLSGEAR